LRTYETPFRLFTWALDWAFGEELNDNEVSLADQMRLWEQDELRKIQEEGLNRFPQGRITYGAIEEQGLDLGRLYKDLRGMGAGMHTGLEQVDNQVGAEWQADVWIRTSSWILEAIGGGYQEGWRTYVV
jgi:hypothetical protein